MVGVVARCAYVAALSHHAFVFSYMLLAMDFSAVPPGHVYARQLQLHRFRFLTTWNLMVQAVYLGLSVLEDVLHFLSSVDPKLLHKAQTHVSAARNYIFGSLVFPTGSLVSLLFWAVYAVDRELVLPRAADSALPPWLNHCIHTHVALLVAACLALRPHRYPSRARGLAGLALFLLTYTAVLVLTYFESGYWLYAVCDRLGTWTNRILLLLMASLATFFFYIIGEQLNQMIWGSQL